MRLIIFVVLFTYISITLANSVSPSDRVVNSVLIKAQPVSTSKVIGRFFPNETAKLINQVAGYYEIRKPSGVQGFVSKSWTVLDTPSKELKIHFINVGQGDATLINCPNDNNILIDLGTSTKSLNNDFSNIESYINNGLVGNKHIDSFFITHPDKDHYVLADNILESIIVDNVFYVGDIDDFDADKKQTPNFKSWFTDIESNKHFVKKTYFDKETEPNPIVNCGEAEIHILAANTPPKDNPKWKSNASSIMLFLKYKHFEAIFTGDGTFGGEELIEKRFDKDWLDIELYKLGHHGSSTTSNSAEWLGILKPEIVIGSSGLGNTYGHPRDEVVERLTHLMSADNHQIVTGKYDRVKKKSVLSKKNISKAFYTTATNGNIVVTTNGNQYNYKVEYDGKTYD